jgi:hypothetical protein
LSKTPRWRGARVGAAVLTTSLTLGLFSAPGVAAPAPSAPSPSTAGQVESTPAENFVDWVYESLLFRDPDPGGRAYWAAMVDEGRKGDFVHFVSASEEWREVWIDVAYHRWLERPVDEAGLDFWLGVLDDGWAYADFEAFLASSDEVYNSYRNPPTPQDENYTVWLYYAATRNFPTDEQIDDAVAMLRDGLRLDLAYEVLLSPRGVEDRVNVAFERTLDRAPDSGGLRFWGQLYVDTGSMSLILAHPLLSDEAWDIAQRPADPLADRRSTANP